METPEIELFVVRNQEGKWFRAKGFNGTGNSWVDDLKHAKIYGKIGQAKSRVTFFAKNYPKYGVPEIVRLKCVEAEIIPQEDRVAKIKEREKKAREKAIIRQREQAIKEAERDIKNAQARLNSLNRKK